MAVRDAIHGSQKLFALVQWIPIFRRCRMKSHEQIALPKRETQTGLQRLTFKQRSSQNGINPQSSDAVDSLRHFPHLYQTISIWFGSNKMYCGHLADRMPNGIIDCALGQFSAVYVCDRQPHQKSCRCSSQYFKPVAEQYNKIRLKCAKGIGKPEHANPRALGHTDTAIRRQQHFYLSIEYIPICFDFLASQPEFRRQMHCRRDDLQCHTGLRREISQQATQQAILGSCSGYHTDTTRHRHSSINSSAAKLRGAGLPNTSSRRIGLIPVPGRFAQRLSRV